MIRCLGLVLLAALGSSCSTSFEREWRQALRQGPQAGAAGAWAGTWQSAANGHHGNLRCVVAPPRDAGGEQSFYYHATWAGSLSGSYRALHRVSPASDGLAFRGRHRLPALAGGVYDYEGKIKGDEFAADYRCAKDHGVFRMQRVKASTPAAVSP
jgi:hypothetical protein